MRALPGFGSLALALLGAALAPARAAQTGDVWALLMATGEHAGLREQDVVRALAERGAGALPLYVDILASRESEPPAAEGAVPPSWDRHAVVLAAIAELPAAKSLPVLRGLAARQREPQGCVALLQALAATGEAEAADVAVEVLAAAELDLIAGPRIAKALSAALADLLHGAPRSAERFLQHFDRLSPGHLSLALPAFATLPADESLWIFEGLFGRSSELDAEVLAHIGRLDPRDVERSGEVAALCIRGQLGSMDAGVRQRAALALGELAGPDDAPDLLWALADGDERVRAAARHVLADLAGRDLGAESAAWESWHERELEWFRTSFADLSERVLEGPPGNAIPALRELTLHRLFRREIALLAAAALERGDPGLAAASCALLEQNGCPIALGALAEQLDAESAPVRANAASALARLTAQRLEPTPAAWSAWLARS